MDFYEALKKFEITTLQGETEDSLKKRYRKLAKKNHPDIKGNTKEKFQSISEAYEELLSSLHKKETEVVNSSWFSSVRKTKDKKVINYSEYVESLDIKTRNINKLKEDYILFLKLNFKISIIHNDVSSDYIESFELRYDNKCEYYINLSYHYEIGDTLKVYLENTELVTYELNKSHFMVVITKNISVLDTMKFMITITQQ